MTREVKIGKIAVGGNNPIRIQSMTTSSTRDVKATVEQAIRLADAGCEIVRVTVQGKKEAAACEGIKNELVRRGYDIPLVADIHFYPPAAMDVVDFVDKVRINPGNFADKRASFKVLEYDDASYQRELERIEEKFAPLVEKCKRLKRAMRIGTNHGSLSDRIMNRYGDTPAGMVESAFEYLRICRNMDYHDVIFSMKSSNPKVMIEAYRLLRGEMTKQGWDYPLHLGVTEAGEGEDGRIKSAMGIGSLLLDGIGDTIRVSLTEDPWYEIDTCQRLIKFVETRAKSRLEQVPKRPITFPKHLSFHRDGTVCVSGDNPGCPDMKLERDSADMIAPLAITQQVEAYQKLGVGIIHDQTLPRVPLNQLSLKKGAAYITDETDFEILKTSKPPVIFFSPKKDRITAAHRLHNWLVENKIDIPLILNFKYDVIPEDFVIAASAECGALLCDGIGQGLFLEGPYESDFLRRLSFGILQAARMRTFKTEFISCPSCGRTLFDLQEVSRIIRKRTEHLAGVKIAIMGCIVNGPGEMADADFGYVGSRPGMIDLYVGKERVEPNISFDDAPDRLVELIKAHDRWEDPD